MEHPKEQTQKAAEFVLAVYMMGVTMSALEYIVFCIPQKQILPVL